MQAKTSPGKASISHELATVFERLGTSADTWRSRMEMLRKQHFLRTVVESRLDQAAGLGRLLILRATLVLDVIDTLVDRGVLACLGRPRDPQQHEEYRYQHSLSKALPHRRSRCS